MWIFCVLLLLYFRLLLLLPFASFSTVNPNEFLVSFSFRLFYDYYFPFFIGVHTITIHTMNFEDSFMLLQLLISRDFQVAESAHSRADRFKFTD